MGAAAPVIAQVFVATATSIITSKIVTEVTGSEELGMIAGVVAGAYMGGQVGGAAGAGGDAGMNMTDAASTTEMTANTDVGKSWGFSDKANNAGIQGPGGDAGMNMIDTANSTPAAVSSSTAPTTAQPRSLNQTSVMSAPKETGFFDSTIDWGAEKIGQGMDWGETVVNKIGDFITGNQGISQTGNSLNTTQTQNNGFLSTSLGKNSLQDLLSSDTMLKGYLYSTALEDQQEYLEEQDEKKFERIQWRSPAELKPISNIKRIV